jgi:hypothetical protein
MQDILYASAGMTFLVALVAGFFALFLVPFHFGTKTRPTRIISRSAWIIRIVGACAALILGGGLTAPGIAAEGSTFLVWGATWVGLAMVSFHFIGVWTRQLAWSLNRPRTWCWWIMAPLGIVGMLLVPVRPARATPPRVRGMPGMMPA